jgi:deaminated glutathione amidase
MARLSAIQMKSVPSVEENLITIEAQLAGLPHADEHLVLLPECCLYFGGKDKEQLLLSQDPAQSELMYDSLADLAQKYHVDLIAGSIPIASMNASSNRFTNTSIAFSRQGKELARYSKIHLFDVEVNDGEKNYSESKYTEPGDAVVNVELGYANVGLSVCYDIRFPELYRQLRTKGADVITVPAAFTKVTGLAHWQTLLQARAIENQVFIVAAGQQGTHANGRETFGHSMIIDPWGDIMTYLSTDEGAVTTEFSLEQLKQIRQAMPVELHNQFESKLK